MRIAIISPLEESVPPKKYGGTEWIVYSVASGIVKKGHTVDLYAPGDSAAEPFHLIPTVEAGMRNGSKYAQDMKLRDSYKLQKTSEIIPLLLKEKYDIVHNHASWRFLLFSAVLKDPIVTTHHGPLSMPYQNIIFEANKDRYHVSISNNQRKDLPNLNYIQTIYNGIDVASYHFLPSVSNNAEMIFLARMSPEKGGIEAAKVAHKTGKKLTIAAKVDVVDQEYYESSKSYIDGTIVKFLGEIDFAKKESLLQNARCLIAPIQWEEPFGLMFVEAMAAGTPVIAYARGAAPEIIQDGINGFLINQSEEYTRGDYIIKRTGFEGLCEAVEKVYAMPQNEYEEMRKNAREHVENKFTIRRMVDEYEKVYEKIIESK